MSFVNFKNVKFFSRKCNSHTLIYDEACLDIASDRDVTVWRQYTKCVECDYAKVLDSNKTGSLLVRTIWPVKYKVEDGYGPVCNGTFNFGEYGRYQLNVTKNGCSNITVTEQPDEPLFPMLVAVVTMLSIATLWYLVKGAYRKISQWEIWNRLMRTESRSELLIGSPNNGTIRRVSTRLRSADVFRGFTIALMIFVNYGGGGYSILRHSPWNGLTIADVVFPWFAWLMGFALCLSLHTRLRTAMKRQTAFFQILRRSVVLIFLGIVLSSKGRIIEELRLPGVLQRLGLAYFIVGTLECFTINASNNYLPGTAIFRDLRSTWWQWSVTLLLVGAHIALSLCLPVPGCPRGYLGPGGLHDNSTAKNCTGGAAAYIDTLVFGEDHLYKGGSFRSLYKATAAFDPEGLLGTLSCALVVQLGVQAARVLLAYSHPRPRLMRWMLWALFTGAVGGSLCLFSENNGPIPINKNLWSISFCLVTSSLAFLIQAFLYFIIDMYTLWEGRPFYYAGRNALLIYVGHDLMKGRFPFEWKLEFPSHMQLLAMNALAVLLWLSIAIVLHRKNVILTV
ncbi:heparan-alpha-glucosaminide N-acetyltransferase-like [Arctopsyche grandis]|uniref:heparan-alpha-glucosaminide N-acetyltransferase-like n=1 Tax=Arctopsyche grandis TaxID=121162 RepID=UPI00406D83E2